MKTSKIINNQYSLLFILWLILTIININKAFHIDDTFHLLAAEYLKSNPFHPMSGLINWGQYPTPMHEFNQPPLFFYLIALFSTIFGNSEISLHLFMSFFTFFALYFFHRVAIIMNIKQNKLLLCIFALCPAFILNQNLMVDVPILAIVLAILYFILKAKKSKSYLHYVIAAALLSIGLMIKYSVLPIAVVLFIAILVNKDYKKLLVFFIPLLTLVLWSIWNKVEYGSMHFLGRPHSSFNIDIFSFIACIGSMSTFLITFLYATFPFKITRITIFSIIIGFIISVLLFYFDFIDELVYSKYINYSFNIVGCLIVIICLIHLLKLIKNNKYNYLKSDSFIILLFLGSTSLFIIRFAPFIATRHILLIIPLILLFGHEMFEQATKRINMLTLIATFTLGMLLSISDWVYADFYRRMASEINIKTDNTIWSCGHWGWQWYSKKNGMKIYSQKEEFNVKRGDYFVYPNDVSSTTISKDFDLILVEKKWETSNFLTFFSGKNYASLYNSFKDKPPWTLSKSPLDTIFVYKVEKEIDVIDIVNRIKSSKSWFESIKDKAKVRGVTIDSMLVMDALWLIDQSRIN